MNLFVPLFGALLVSPADVIDCVPAQAHSPEVNPTGRPLPTPGAGFSNGSWNNPLEAQPHGVEHHTYQSDSMKVEVGFNIYLPPQYTARPRERFPVIYWLHGLGGNENSDLSLTTTLDAAIGSDRVSPMILVFVNGGTRSRYCDDLEGMVKAETTIIRELIPHVDGHWRTIATSKGRAIQGMSMGGQGALRLAFKYPQIFGSVFSFAGALLNGERMVVFDPAMIEALFGGDKAKFDQATAFAIARQNAESIRGLAITMVCGTTDALLPRNQALHDQLKELAIAHQFKTVEGVGHSLPDLMGKLGIANFEFAADNFAILDRRTD